MYDAKPLTETPNHARGPLHTALNRAGRALIVSASTRLLEELSRLERAARAYSGETSGELEQERARALDAERDLQRERERSEQIRLEALELRMNLERAEEELEARRGRPGGHE